MHKRLFQKRNVYLLIVCVACLVVLGAIYRHYQNRPKMPDLPSPPLKVLAQKQNIELGNFAIATHLNDPIYTAILAGQFNLALVDNTPNWYFTDGGLRPSATTYNFKQMDKIVSFAQTNHMRVQAHHLVWGEDKWLPDWLKNGHYSSAQLLQIIHDHINTVAGHYKGKVNEWTVVNEAFTRGQHVFGLHDWWADNIGNDSYISDSFIWAHQADPSAKLILNDFGDETQNSVSDAMYNYIKQAKASGVPINGVGMQMHLDGSRPPSKQAVIASMRRFASLGVGVYVTEFDVNMSTVHASDKTKDQQEAAIYYNMVRACIESGVCHSFSILGITDQETWYNYLGNSPDARPLPFDNTYRPKPAFYSLRSALY